MAEQREELDIDRTGVELFAGGGGLAMAVQRAGFRPLLFNEVAKKKKNSNSFPFTLSLNLSFNPIIRLINFIC
ncbi:hypothetical protein [Staphylococcus aureus]|uniref:hypothetical protein n=1 Tax=Staphylococcus aureus TaxID=1280 RepID=UPI001C2F2377